MNTFMFLILSTMVIPQEEMRFTHVFKQNFDTSCGISTTATLLNKYWNISVFGDEMYQEILDRLEDGDIDYTINFLTIAEFLLRHSIQSRAFKMDWDQLVNNLAQGFGPIIVHYNRPLPHFALLLHIEDDYAFVADPARGYEAIDRKTFLQRYSGNVLLAASRVHQKDEVYLQQVISEKRTQINRLQQLARRRW